MSQRRHRHLVRQEGNNGTKTYRSKLAAIAAGLALVGSSLVGVAAPAAAGPGITDLTWTPDIQFGEIFAGTQTDYTLKLTNTGTDPKDLTEIEVEGGSAANLTVTSHDCQVVLDAGEFCEIKVTFHPTNVDDGILASVQVKLDGDWITTYFRGKTVHPLTAQGSTDLDFGEVFTGDTKEMQFFLGNTSGATVTVGEISGGAGGATSDPFLRVSDCAGQTLLPGELCAMTYTFTPFKADDFEEGPGASTNVSVLGVRYSPTLTGTGVLAWDLSPATLDFGSVPLGGSKTMDIIATNVSDTDRIVTPFQFNYGGQLTTAGTCDAGTQVSAGQSCTITLTYGPVQTDPISKDSTLNFGGARYPISIQGKGVTEPDYDMWQMSPVDLDFGDVIVGESASLETVLTFAGEGIGTFFPKDIDFGSDFEVTSDCEPYGSYNVGEFCTFTVTFTPSDVDVYDESDTVSFYGSEFALTATGAGIAGDVDPELSDWEISPPALSFLLPQVGLSATEDFVVTNQSGAERTVPFFDLNFGPEFTIENACTPGLQLADGQTCTISVTYTAVNTDFIQREVDLAFGDWVFPLSVSAMALEEPDYDMWVMSPLDLDFGDVLVGESKDLTTTLTFVGEGYGIIYPKVIDLGPGFSLVSDCEDFDFLEVDEFCTFTVTFTPTGAQKYTGTDTVSFYGSEFTLTATGTGITKPALPETPEVTDPTTPVVPEEPGPVIDNPEIAHNTVVPPTLIVSQLPKTGAGEVQATLGLTALALLMGAGLVIHSRRSLRIRR